jgi:hypothetical protein
MSKFVRNSNGTWVRIDGQPIADIDIPELIELGLKAALQREKQSTNPKYHRTPVEQKLAFEFSQMFKEQVSDYNNAIYDEVNLVRQLVSSEDKILQCRKAINIYKEAQTFCYSKGQGGQIYFDDMWEHCHNSKNDCFSFIQKTRDL